MNIVKMQEMLKGVPENALVGYVQNPGQVPAYLALGEIQRRKKMREEAATQAQAPQQSVAEQMVAQAQPAPMDMGVASLPGAESVGNEEAYAQGGIVGYKEGDLVDLDTLVEEAKAKRQREADAAYAAALEKGTAALGRDLSTYGAVLGDISSLGTAASRDILGTIGSAGIADMRLVRDPESGKLVPAHAVQGWMPRTTEALGMPRTTEALSAYPKTESKPEKQRKPISQIVAEQKAAAVPGVVDMPNFAQDIANMNRIQIERKIKEGIYPDPITGKYATKGNAPKPQPRPGDARTRTDNGATKSGTPAASPAPAGGVADLLKYDEIPFDESAYAPIKEIGAKGHMQEWRDLIGEDPGRAGLNKRMTKLESRAAETERQAPWQAFTKAGLAMASGSSPFWVQNVGKGAMVGVEDYSKSRGKLQELEEKRFDMAQRLAAADRAETIAAAKYGADSAQVDRAANEKRQLQKLTNSLDVRIANAKGKFEAQKGNLSAQIDREKMASEEKMAAARNAATLAGYKRYESAADKALIQQRTSLLNNMLDEVRANLSKMRDGSLMATPEQVRAEEARYNQILSELAKVANVDISAPPAAPIDYTSAYGLTPRPKQK